MIRLVAFSDIHGSVPAVEALVETEARNVDAVVVAGDIGRPAPEFFRALEGFECPLLYVYGNWDYDLDYDRVFCKRFVHLHGTVAAVGDLRFVGFSGCATQWGRNPIWLQLEAEVERAHRATIDRLIAANAADEAAGDRIDKVCDSELAEISRKFPDKTRPSYKIRAQAIERKRSRLQGLKCSRVDRLKQTRAFRLLWTARATAWNEALICNRKAVVDRVQQSDCDPSRVVLVAHQRLYRLPEDCAGLGAHFFGHQHGFKVTKQRGTLFVNVSVLDPTVVKHGQYGLIEWAPVSGFRVFEKRLSGRNLFKRCIKYRVRGESGPTREARQVPWHWI
jgi:predicted phosphodiesterase